MAGTHIQALYRQQTGPLHRLMPHVKLATTLLFVLAVVATPRHAFWAFAVHAVVLIALTATARIPPGFVLRRMLIEIPFLLFAVFLPFVGTGERVEVAGISLSLAGLWAAWNILAKATLGVWASILLAATTQVPHLLEGLHRLRFPRVITAIMGFMVRYLDLVADQWSRMGTALRSRAYRPRSIRRAGALAAAIGALFVRSYERGERVHQAMLSRGFDGTMPSPTGAVATGPQWSAAAAVAGLAAAVAAAGWLIP